MKNLRAAATPFTPEIISILNASKVLEKSKYKKEVKNDLFFDKLPLLLAVATKTLFLNTRLLENHLIWQKNIN